MIIAYCVLYNSKFNSSERSLLETVFIVYLKHRSILFITNEVIRICKHIFFILLHPPSNCCPNQSTSILDCFDQTVFTKNNVYTCTSADFNVYT